MASVFCPVCGTENPSTRQFCRKCAADLRAPVPDPNAPAPPPPVEVPVRPIVLGAAIALIAVIAVVGLLLVLGGSPAASPSPAPSRTPAPTSTPAPSPTAAPPSKAPTAAPTAAPTPTDVPPPSIVSFEGPPGVDCSSFSGTIHLTWRAANAEGTTLAIDGPGLYKNYPGVLGQDDVPFGCGGQSHTYTLTTVGGNGPPVSQTLVIPQTG